jgi:8-oxo-dGTP pyrophosphatase MutT (NUDIX family)
MSVIIDGIEYPLDPVLPPQGGKDTRWEIILNGQGVTDDVDNITVINRAMGIGFIYGASPVGPYNQGRIVNRGGAVIAPTVEVNGVLYFLALVQNRPLVGSEPIFEFPRGQAIFGENTVDTAQRELLEETGLPLNLENLLYLGNGNPDSALFHGANIHSWWLKLPENFVVIQEDGTPTLRPDIEANPESKLIESIRNAVFVPATQFKSPSMMTTNVAGLVFQQYFIMTRSQI